MDIKNYKKIHFIGIGGISMSGLAEIAAFSGISVSGSDSDKNFDSSVFEKKGITFYKTHDKNNIKDDTELVVYTAAVKKDNPELIEAKKRQIPAIERAEFLGIMMKDFTYPVCIAGTHGKTTTTSMLAEIFIEAGVDPTISVGGKLDSIHGNIRIGANKYFIVESCEYCDSFLKFFPHSAIILNIEKDHTDYFKSMEQLYDSFKKFLSLIPENSFAVINKDIPDFQKLTQDLKCSLITFGRDFNADWRASDILYDKKGHPSYTVLYKGKNIGNVMLNVYGEHNVYNSLSAFALSYNYGIDVKHIIKGLENFKGTHRRFEHKGFYNGAEIIDDYAHHPTEIRTTLCSAKKQDINRLICVFQPHTYSRTKSLINEFANSFDDADIVILTDIYAAREKDTGEIHSKDLYKLLEEKGKKVFYFKNFSEIENFLKSTLNPHDMLITIGAGNVYLIGESLI